ncbi:glycosyl hydrolase family protein [Striga asiatica]|uniref:Glycosyl hydrolase family protein n=1 Tax=Striga asiatica TaxID=4170 RepID=A0A5A7PXN2_STRAF|nr:glycosyl hydrolase family protein [Striga asiatica]
MDLPTQHCISENCREQNLQTSSPELFLKCSRDGLPVVCLPGFPRELFSSSALYTDSASKALAKSFSDVVASFDSWSGEKLPVGEEFSLCSDSDFAFSGMVTSKENPIQKLDPKQGNETCRSLHTIVSSRLSSLGPSRMQSASCHDRPKPTLVPQDLIVYDQQAPIQTGNTQNFKWIEACKTSICYSCTDLKNTISTSTLFHFSDGLLQLRLLCLENQHILHSES